MYLAGGRAAYAKRLKRSAVRPSKPQPHNKPLSPDVEARLIERLNDKLGVAPPEVTELHEALNDEWRGEWT
jgi:hypothetical protein